MTQYEALNINLFNSQLNKLKLGTKEGTVVTLSLSPLLTNTQVARICKDFENGLSANKKLSKAQLSKIAQSGGSLLLINNLMVPIIRVSIEIPTIGDRIGKIKSIPKGLLDAGSNPVNNKFNIKPLQLLNGSRKTLKSNEIKDIMKVIRSLDHRGILSKRITKIISSQEEGFLNFLRPLINDYRFTINEKCT